MTKHVCILGTHHYYQYRSPRIGFARALRDLVDLWNPDFIGEEFDDCRQDPSYTKMLADVLSIPWDNVDLKTDERPHFPDANPLGAGTQVDLSLQNAREWVWLIRTNRRMKDSALIVCGLTHAFSLGIKFEQVGFEVDINLYWDKTDDTEIKKRKDAPEKFVRTLLRTQP
jgi:hypothetical protein